MYSINESKQDNLVAVSKAKVMAVKYQKYFQSKSTKKSGQNMQCIQRWIKNINTMLYKAWNTTMPIFIRGPSTPYEVLIKTLSNVTKIEQQNIPFSQITVSQAAKISRINLLVTYTQISILQTLSKINNNQQINSLINKKSEIIPIKISKSSTVNDLQAKLRDIIQVVGNNFQYEQQIFVIWKGLYEEILVIAHFQLSDPQLSYKVLNAIQQREDYEDLVKKFANCNNQIYEQSSLNKLSGQSTGIQRQTEH